MKRFRTPLAVVTSLLAVALFAQGASATYTLHTAGPIVTQTNIVHGSEYNTCGDQISGDSGWYSQIAPDQIGDPLPVQATGTAVYDVFAFPQGWDFASDGYIFDATSPHYAIFDANGNEIQTAPLVLRFTTLARSALPTPIQDGPRWIYTNVAFAATISPAAPVGSTLGIEVPGDNVLRKLMVVDCTPAPLTITGFSAPVDNSPVVNGAKAGQSIPMKFRVTDASGSGVTGLTLADVVVTSHGDNCGVNDVVDPIEEYAGNSGLNDMGNGYYQFNWKSPKSYAGQCRTVKVSADGGSLTADFRFR